MNHSVENEPACYRCDEPIAARDVWATIEIRNANGLVHRETIHIEHIVTAATKLRFPT